MNIIFSVEVVAAGTPGPLLGDGVNTIVTMLYPLALTEAGDTLGSRESVINSAASPRRSYTVARFVVMGRGDNTDVAYLIPRGSDSDSGRRVASYEELPPIGFGDRNDTDLGDFDVDAETTDDALVVWAEVR
jgi:hypothetical protein